MTRQQMQTENGKKKAIRNRNTNKKVSPIEAAVQGHVLQKWLSRKSEKSKIQFPVPKFA